MRVNHGNSSLRRPRRRGDAMAAYDRLPAELRGWLAQAALPWSPRSALRAWQAALARTGGDPAHARHRLSEIERRQLGRDARRVWEAGHPALG